MRRDAGWLCQRSTGLLIILILLAAAVGCGSSADGASTVRSARVLSAAEAKRLLSDLPYRYRWREVEAPEGAASALAGKATGKHHASLHFGISFGVHSDPVVVPQSGTSSAYAYSRGGFVFTDDVVTPHGVGRQIKNAAQWREANLMVVKMEEALCKAATGEVCPP